MEMRADQRGAGSQQKEAPFLVFTEGYLPLYQVFSLPGSSIDVSQALLFSMVPDSQTRGQAVGLGIIKVSFLCQAQYIQLPHQHLGLNSRIPSSNGRFLWDAGSQDQGSLSLKSR